MTRMGMGVVMTAGAAKLAPASPSAARLSSVPHVVRKRVGPFQAAVERFVVTRNGGGRPTALVQLHLSRPAGPVPMGERERVDGVGALGGRWVLSSIAWLPAEAGAVHVPGLGKVEPAEQEAEARGIFRFVYLGRDQLPVPPTNFTFELPSGEAAVINGLVPEGQLS